jgi:transcriptional regulator with XRE-family HTH domain
MTNENTILHTLLGRRIAELRKGMGLSQSDLASRLSRKRTQAWVSTVETGRRIVNVDDLFEIATIFGVSIGGIADTPSQFSSPSQHSLGDFLRELNTRLPIEMPVYLQRDLGEQDSKPIDHQYTSNVPGRTLFDANYQLAQEDASKVMVVERYYDSPKLNPTDLVTYSSILIPHPDPNPSLADRVLVRLQKPHAGLSVHPCLIRSSGDAEMTLSGDSKTVIAKDTFEVLGVLVLRRTLYRSSIIRTWLQRQFGISKDERME